jgi:hypothetical protein
MALGSNGVGGVGRIGVFFGEGHNSVCGEHSGATGQAACSLFVARRCGAVAVRGVAASLCSPPNSLSELHTLLSTLCRKYLLKFSNGTARMSETTSLSVLMRLVQGYIGPSNPGTCASSLLFRLSVWMVVVSGV